MEIRFNEKEKCHDTLGSVLLCFAYSLVVHLLLWYLTVGRLHTVFTHTHLVIVWTLCSLFLWHVLILIYTHLARDETSECDQCLGLVWSGVCTYICTKLYVYVKRTLHVEIDKCKRPRERKTVSVASFILPHTHLFCNRLFFYLLFNHIK